MAPAQLSRAILPTSGAVEREFREMITDGWFGTWFLFFHRLGIIIPTDLGMGHGSIPIDTFLIG